MLSYNKFLKSDKKRIDHNLGEPARQMPVGKVGSGTANS